MSITSESIKFYPKSHRYKNTETGEWIPSVTTIAGMLDKPYLMEWAAREAATAGVMSMAEHEGALDENIVGAFIESSRAAPRNQRDHGRLVGSDVHERIHCHFDPHRERDPNVEDGGMEADLAFEAFEQWLELADIAEVLLVEQVVVHPSGLYVGTPDLLFRSISGQVCLTDFKTSNQSESNPLALYPEYLLQLCAYKEAIEQSPQFPWPQVDLINGVALGKNGNLEQWGLTDDDINVEKATGLFLTLADSYRLHRDIVNVTNQMNRARKNELKEEAANV